MDISQWDLSGFIRDGKSGKLSATRIVFICWGLAAILASVATIMGLLAGGKTIQKFRERGDSG